MSFVIALLATGHPHVVVFRLAGCGSVEDKVVRWVLVDRSDLGCFCVSWFLFDVQGGEEIVD